MHVTLSTCMPKSQELFEGQAQLRLFSSQSIFPLSFCFISNNESFFPFSLFPCSAPIETVRFLLLLPSQITHMLILSHSLLHLNPSFFQPQCILFIHPSLSHSLSFHDKPHNRAKIRIFLFLK